MRRFAAIHFIFLLFLAAAPNLADQFNGLDSATLDPVENDPGKWGLKIVVFSIGQGDAILVLAPNGDAS